MHAVPIRNNSIIGHQIAKGGLHSLPFTPIWRLINLSLNARFGIIMAISDQRFVSKCGWWFDFSIFRYIFNFLKYSRGK